MYLYAKAVLVILLLFFLLPLVYANLILWALARPRTCPKMQKEIQRGTAGSLAKKSVMLWLTWDSVSKSFLYLFSMSVVRFSRSPDTFSNCLSTEQRQINMKRHDNLFLCCLLSRHIRLQQIKPRIHKRKKLHSQILVHSGQFQMNCRCSSRWAGPNLFSDQFDWVKVWSRYGRARGVS